MTQKSAVLLCTSACHYFRFFLALVAVSLHSGLALRHVTAAVASPSNHICHRSVSCPAHCHILFLKLTRYIPWLHSRCACCCILSKFYWSKNLWSCVDRRTDGRTDRQTCWWCPTIAVHAGHIAGQLCQYRSVSTQVRCPAREHWQARRSLQSDTHYLPYPFTVQWSLYVPHSGHYTANWSL